MADTEVKIATDRRSDGNMTDWSTNLHRTHPALSAQLAEKRSAGFQNLDKLNLPRYQRLTVSLPSFLGNPEKTVAPIDAEQFYITLLPNTEELSRFSKSGIALRQVVDYVREKVDPAVVHSYEICIQQFFENKYGGNIVINKDGGVYVEFAEGKQGPIAKGKKTPEFFVTQDNFTGSLRFSFEDTLLRRMIINVLRAIPHCGTDRDTRYHPGYYEFLLVRRDSSSRMKPIFIDYRDNPAYQLAPPHFDGNRPKRQITPMP